MKKLLFLMVALIGLSSMGYAQKYGYIYSEKVFKAMPEYGEALEKIEAYAKQGRDSVELLYKQAQNSYEALTAVSDRITASQYEALAKQPIALERSATEYNEKFFGKEGDLVEYRKSLMNPIEKRVMEAVETLVAKDGYDMIFDMSVMKMTVYQSPELDLTDEVIGIVTSEEK